MVDSRKRSRPKRDNDGDRKNQRRDGNNRDEKSDKDLIVYRILCPGTVIGSVIGKSGKVINSIRQDTKAMVKVVDPFPGARDRVVLVYCYVKQKEDVDLDDEFDEREPLCSAQDALLKVHATITEAVSAFGDSEKNSKNKDECQILVPSSQAANIIGKSGSTIKRLRSKTRANIKVTAKDVSDPTHSCAMDFDNFVLINGDSEAVKRALFAISTIMYKFEPKEDIPLTTTVPEAQSSIIVVPEVSNYAAAGLYPSLDPLIPSRSVAPVPQIPVYPDTASAWPIYSSSLPVVSSYGNTSRSEELVVRVLCPYDKIGRVIGKGGSSIKSMRQESGARVEVDDRKHDECLIIVTSQESIDDLKSMAIEAVLLLQGKINEEDDDPVYFRLLVPRKVIGTIIGKGGSIINEIRKRTRTDVRISKGEKPKCADDNDELIEVIGDVGNVRDALIQIILRLRDDVLKETEDGRRPTAGADSVYPGSTGLSLSSVLPGVPPSLPLDYDRRAEASSGFGMHKPNSLHGYGSLPVDNDSYQRSLSSYSPKPYGGLPPPSALEMVIPGNAVVKVLGKGGANIANISKISGAVVEVSDPKSSRGDLVAVISGTLEQKRTAENLIQAFIMAT